MLRRLHNDKRWAGFSLLFCLVAVASSEGTNIVDTRVYEFFHDTYRAPYLDRAMETATRLGDRQTLLASSLLLATYGGKREHETAKLLTASLIGSQLVVAGGKFITNRSRPDGRLSPRSNSSFPSGHAAGAFATAAIVANRYHIAPPILYGGASIVALSRIYLGRHFPSDVITGALIGYVGSKLVVRFQERILRMKFSRNVEIYLTTPLFFVSLQETD
ncbi:MAG: phosphatase PAP2 family protein [Candidatus Latescibacteria bacterium]|nr:phosphatase PAP2 family protein [Candidatus Latescibacterota bacterium]